MSAQNGCDTSDKTQPLLSVTVITFAKYQGVYHAIPMISWNIGVPPLISGNETKCADHICHLCCLPHHAVPLMHYVLLCFQPGEGQLSMASLCSACATLAQKQMPLFLLSISISTVCGFWLVDTVSEQLFGSATVYGTTNGCSMAVKQIQKGLTGLHLISRMLKVRLKQIRGKWEKHKIKYIEFHSVVS